MKRVHLLPTIFIIALLGVAEALAISWLWPTQPSDKEKIARLERLVQEKDQEINKLILERGRIVSVRADAVNSRSSLGSKPIVPSERLSPEMELEQATERARQKRANSNARDNTTPDHLTSMASTASMASPISANSAAANTFNETDLAIPSDLDAAHLVAVANMIAGERKARLMLNAGRQAIEYKAGPWNETDPLWKILQTVIESESLRTISIIGSATESAKMKQDLSSFGIPSNKFKARGREAGNSRILIELETDDNVES